MNLQYFCYTLPMKTLIATLCLTIAVLLGGVGNSESDNTATKGVLAYQKGDYAIALRELIPPAEEGNGNAQLQLGIMYAWGHGVLQDYIRAHMWWNIASSNGYDNARRNRDKLAKKMTPSQIELAQKLARECVRKKYKGC